MTKTEINALSYLIVGAAIEVHRELGPGLLESIYEQAMEIELSGEGIEMVRQYAIPVTYKGTRLDQEYRIDLLVQDIIVVELKATKLILPVHKAQLLTYMKIMKKPKGLLINFNCSNISKTYVSLVNEYYANLPA